MTRITFACGAYYEVESTGYKAGNRLMTMATSDSTVVNRPRIPDDVCAAEDLPVGSVANCLLMCPALVKESKRKVQRAYIGNDREVSLCVTCRIKEVA